MGILKIVTEARKFFPIFLKTLRVPSEWNAFKGDIQQVWNFFWEYRSAPFDINVEQMSGVA